MNNYSGYDDTNWQDNEKYSHRASDISYFIE